MKFKFCGTQGSHSPLPITPYTLQYLHYPLFPLVPHPSAFTPHSLCLQNVITFLFWLIGALLQYNELFAENSSCQIFSQDISRFSRKFLDILRREFRKNMLHHFPKIRSNLVFPKFFYFCFAVNPIGSALF